MEQPDATDGTSFLVEPFPMRPSLLFRFSLRPVSSVRLVLVLQQQILPPSRYLSRSPSFFLSWDSFRALMGQCTPFFVFVSSGLGHWESRNYGVELLLPHAIGGLGKTQRDYEMALTKTTTLRCSKQIH